MVIVIDNLNEGKKIFKFLSSIVFNKIIKAYLWSSFRIKWWFFKDLKKNFYEIIDDKNVTTKKAKFQNIINKEITDVKVSKKIIINDKKDDKLNKKVIKSKVNKNIEI
jgi:hypothetical protein